MKHSIGRLIFFLLGAAIIIGAASLAMADIIWG